MNLNSQTFFLISGKHIHYKRQREDSKLKLNEDYNTLTLIALSK